MQLEAPWPHAVQPQVNAPAVESNRPLSWRNILLMALVHVAALGGTTAYALWHGVTLAAVLIGAAFAGVTIFAISAGYHRLVAHRAYEAHPVFRAFLLIFGAATFQNSALAWAADHRRHHASTDTEMDPYDVSKGFWYAHIGWVFREGSPAVTPMPVHDLEADPLIRWQHRHFGLIAIAAGLVLPTLIGLMAGDPLGGFVIGAALRLFVTYHTTFAINSFAHIVGSRPYSRTTSARDSFWIALLSMGEGYHNFHHVFPADYRNGVGRLQWDPTKWVLFLLSKVGVVSRLHRTRPAAVERAKHRAAAPTVAAG